jgi:hypothetical protein
VSFEPAELAKALKFGFPVFFGNPMLRAFCVLPGLAHEFESGGIGYGYLKGGCLVVLPSANLGADDQEADRDHTDEDQSWRKLLDHR